MDAMIELLGQKQGSNAKHAKQDAVKQFGLQTFGTLVSPISNSKANINTHAYEKSK